MIKVTDYITDYIISKGITDVFGYPGGVVCHLLDSFRKRKDELTVHTAYHEQGAAFAACGYAQEKGVCGLAFATSGPGATNLITGIANAYYDYIPVIFITGQTDTYCMKEENSLLRQRGFQETDIVSMVKGITKYAVCIKNKDNVVNELEKAYEIAITGAPGPVLIDLPADIQRAEICFQKSNSDIEANKINPYDNKKYQKDIQTVLDELGAANRPCLLIGNGVKRAGKIREISKLIHNLNIPTVFTLPALDILPYKDTLNMGFIGVNGLEYAQEVLNQCDLLISIGSRLDIKQTGNDKNQFAPNAKLIRIDIDDVIFENDIKEDEIKIQVNLKLFVDYLNRYLIDMKVSTDWYNICRKIKAESIGKGQDSTELFIAKVCDYIPEEAVITVDTGWSQVLALRSIKVKKGQTIHMSAGLGSMGYSIPAAIGGYYAKGKEPYSINGDGGFQMNMQEMMFAERENIPMKIIVLNDKSLGMIKNFQRKNFESVYTQTTEETGYKAPNFKKLAEAYSFEYVVIKNEEDLMRMKGMYGKRMLIEVSI